MQVLKETPLIKTQKEITTPNQDETMKSIEPTPIYKNVPSLIARLPVALRNRRAVMIFGLLVLTLGMTLN